MKTEGLGLLSSQSGVTNVVQPHNPCMSFGFQEFPECQAAKLQLIQDVKSNNAASPFASDSVVNGCHIQEYIGDVRVVKMVIAMIPECP
jgi:hypothetical protein